MHSLHWLKKCHTHSAAESSSSRASRCIHEGSHSELNPSLTAFAQLFMHLMPDTAIRAAGHESPRGLLGGINHLYC